MKYEHISPPAFLKGVVYFIFPKETFEIHNN